jgi:hypothetical protein
MFCKLESEFVSKDTCLWGGTTFRDTIWPPISIIELSCWKMCSPSCFIPSKSKFRVSYIRILCHRPSKNKFPCQNIRLHTIKFNVCILICIQDFSLDCKCTGAWDFKLKTYRTGSKANANSLKKIEVILPWFFGDMYKLYITMSVWQKSTGKCGQNQSSIASPIDLAPCTLHWT